MSDTFRTSETRKKYSEYQASGAMETGCDLCEKVSLKEFKHWRIVQNTFPYDRIAKMHDMLIPRRCVRWQDLTQDEVDEFFLIKEGHLQEYDHLIESTQKSSSIPKHYHLHLIVKGNDV